MLKGSNEMVEVDVIGVPKWQMDDLCRALLGAVRKFYESEENVKKFQEWKQARERRRKEENNEH